MRLERIVRQKGIAETQELGRRTFFDMRVVAMSGKWRCGSRLPNSQQDAHVLCLTPNYERQVLVS
jgi:hypothetical protein